jgi:hypothetical protein
VQSWAEKWKMREKARAAALALPGAPIPGTGRSRRRCSCGYCRDHKMRPYLRPRKGGGTSKRNEVYD